MMLINSLSFNVYVSLSSVCKGFKKVIKHFRWHLTYHFSCKFCFPNQPRSSAKIQSHLSQRIVHGQREAIALYPFFISQCLGKTFSQCNCSIFDGMVLVNFQVTCGFNVQIHPTVTGNLIQHMIKKSNSSINLTFSRSIQI